MIFILILFVCILLTAWLVWFLTRRVADGILLHQQQEYSQLYANHQQITKQLFQTQTALASAQALSKQIPELKEQLANQQYLANQYLQTATNQASKLSAFAQQAEYFKQQENELCRLKNDYVQLQQQLVDSQVIYERLRVQLLQERQAFDDKIALLQQTRDEMGERFRQLADQVIEEKSQKINEQQQNELYRLLNPLNERIGDFSQLVQNTYEKESRERLTLENELKRLQQLNSRLHDDAHALTQALTGTRNKTQGNWGEMILESVLENSGLQNGREYSVQMMNTRTEEDGSCRRLQPDILLHLPDGKQIVIDSKVSLTAYVRYTQSQDAADLAAHIQSIRHHLKDLSTKRYGELDGVKTLDFVFMFIPVEPAYLLALQHDATLFQECFDKRIMLTGPSTLLATLRTVANIWRHEQQNQNALAIAEEGGRLYDKFVNFVQTLENVGKNLEQAQYQFQTAFNQLKDGRGNLISRAERLHQLGVKTGKKLDRNLTDEAEQ